VRGEGVGSKGGTTNFKGGLCNGRWGVNTVKTLTFEKGGEYMTPPPYSYHSGAAPVWKVLNTTLDRCTEYVHHNMHIFFTFPHFLLGKRRGA